MSGQHYAQATSEENTELVTNRAGVNSTCWNPIVASYEEQPSLEAHGTTNLASNFSNLYLSSHSNSFTAPVSSQYSQFGVNSSFLPNVQSESHAAQNTEVTETQQAIIPDQHLR